MLNAIMLRVVMLIDVVPIKLNTDVFYFWKFVKKNFLFFYVNPNRFIQVLEYFFMLKKSSPVFKGWSQIRTKILHYYLCQTVTSLGFNEA
jgi:hypothetical protein